MSDLSRRRTLFGGLVVSTAAAATGSLMSTLRTDGLSPMEWALLAVFAILVTWISSSFWMACVGTYVRLKGLSAGPTAQAAATAPAARPRTAVVMPVYNEELGRVFAGLQAVCESVRDAGEAAAFDFYLLSDSTDPRQWIAEELEWVELRRSLGDDVRVYYRHRARNHCRKSGNIADFCENWGALYDYMVILDADSLMTGATLSEMVRLMDAHPRAALIQAPPQIVNRESLFARLQQFASSVYGPLWTVGLGYLLGPDGNYWGHNAIIRVQPFMRHCGLPTLPGKAPLGGEILSHDFVEAALLRRAGWELWMAPELGGSYEEPPPSLLDHLKRDRRWCQGNLQHIRLIFARHLNPVSRVHFMVGAMGYLSSPLWLVLLILFAAETFRSGLIEPVVYVGQYPMLAWSLPRGVGIVILIVATLGMLFLPKFLALGLILRDPASRAAHGGALRATAGVILENVYSTLLAPVLMLTHSWFVVATLFGWKTEWGTQQRGEHAVPFAAALAAFLPHTIVAAVLSVLAVTYMPDAIWWFVPVLAGLALAVPLCLVTGSRDIGRTARRLGLFLAPCETTGVPILRRVAEIMADRRYVPPTDPLTQVIEDPFVNALHATVLAGAPESARAPAPPAELLETAAGGGVASLPRQDQVRLLSHPETVSALHAAAWARRLGGNGAAAG